MKQEDQSAAQKLAFVNSVSENAYSNELVAEGLLNLLYEKYPDKIKNHYGLTNDDICNIQTIAHARNWIIAGGAPDIERTAIYILKDFREGKIGKFILD